MAGETYPAAGTTVNYNQPSYYTDTGAALAGGLQGMLGDSGYLNYVSNNWYNQAPGQGALGQYATWNPNQQQQFMNPYTQNVVNEQARLSNQNLFENVIPQVNSTFTGAGQFGSTRNADFMNRAIRDQQYTLAGQQGQTLFNAQNAANQQYKDWTQMGTQAAQQDFTNWLQKANFPIGALAQMGQVFQGMRPGQASSVSTSQAPLDNLGKLAGVLGVLNSGLTDDTIDKLLGWAGIDFNAQV